MLDSLRAHPLRHLHHCWRSLLSNQYQFQSYFIFFWGLNINLLINLTAVSRRSPMVSELSSVLPSSSFTAVTSDLPPRTVLSSPELTLLPFPLVGDVKLWDITPFACLGLSFFRSSVVGFLFHLEKVHRQSLSTNSCSSFLLF